MRRLSYRGVLTREFDWVLFWITVFICLLGFAFLYSASPEKSISLQNVFYRQLVWLGIAFLAFWVALWLDYKFFLNWAYFLYGINLVLLILVLVSGRATKLGAQRWLGVGPFAIQPSEFAKITFILALSRFLHGRDLSSNLLRTLLGGFLLFALPGLLILREPNLGTTLMLFLILVVLLYAAGLRRDLFVFLSIFLCLLAPLGWLRLKPYQRERVLVFVNPDMDPLGSGYTVIQSRISIGSGGLWGKGWLQGTQSQLNFLPERHTDFIFSVIAEEGGFAASVIIVLLFWLIVQKGFLICAQTPDRFGGQIACGVTTMIGLQAFINLGMTMGLLPVVGMPLPLVSYGGTSVVITMLSIGLLLNIKVHRPLF